MSRLFQPDPNVQRVIHYNRIRPFRAFMLLFSGYLIGWLASCDTGRQTAIQAACGPIPLPHVAGAMK